MVTGIYNITAYPGIFRAIDPSRAVMCKSAALGMQVSNFDLIFAGFVRTKQYDLLAGVLLAVTGCEAMFAKYVRPRHQIF